MSLHCDALTKILSTSFIGTYPGLQSNRHFIKMTISAAENDGGKQVQKHGPKPLNIIIYRG